MTAIHVNGVDVVADEPTRAPIKDRGGNPVLWRQVRTLRLADGSTVYGCAHCGFVRETAMAVLPHLPAHSTRSTPRPVARQSKRPANPLMAALADERNRRGLSLRFMERRTGYPRATLRRWEQGVNDPTVTAAQDYAMALGIDLVLFRRPAVEAPFQEAS